MNINKEDITIVILAGGKSERMDGQDKGLMRINKKYVIKHLYDICKEYSDEIYVNANRNIDIYNKNTYEKRLQSMPFFYLDSVDEYDSDIKLEYNLLKNIPWHYDFDIYEKVLHELNIVKDNDIWDNYKHTKK